MAAATADLQGAVKNIIDSLRTLRSPDGPETLVLLIDDIDLRPQIALELLQTVHLFFNQPGVVVVVAADKELLLEAIHETICESFKESQQQEQTLPAALLQKYIPYEWHVPVPTYDERFDTLWPDPANPASDPGPEPPSQGEPTPALEEQPELARWWPNDARSQQLANELLTPLLPDTYRQLHAFRNRLISWRPLLAREESDDIPFLVNGHYLNHWRQLLFAEDVDQLHLLDGIPALMSMFLALDVQYPSCGLWAVIERYPEQVLDALELIANRPTPTASSDTSADEDEDDDDDEDTNRSDPFESSNNELLTRLKPPYIPDEYVRVARQQMRTLVDGWLVLIGAEEPAMTQDDLRFVCVSLNADAMALARRLWHQDFREEQVAALHIDLRQPDRDATHFPPEQLREARARAISQLDQRGIRELTGSVAMFLRTKLSIALWLGWELRDLHDLVVYSWSAGKMIPLRAPERLPFRDRGIYELMEPDSLPGAQLRANHAVVIFDFIRKAQVAQLSQFRDNDDEPVACQHRVLLQAPPDSVNADSVEPLLSDCIELLGELRNKAVTHFHVGVAGPDALTLLLGQQIRAFGIFHVYEHYGDAYRWVFDLEP